MFGKKHPEVLVVGAGPVGLYTALALSRQGIRAQLIEKEWKSGGHSYALALHPYSLQLFREVGLLDAIMEHSYLVHTIGLYDRSARRAEIRLAEPGNELAFVAVLQQNILEHLLEEALKAQGVDVMWNHALSDLEQAGDHVEAGVDKLVLDSVGYAVAHTEWVVAKSSHLKVPFVIGTDGHRSFVRKLMGIEFEQFGETQHFAVFEFKTDANLKHEMRLSMTDGLLNVLWPLPDGYCRWSFQLHDYEAPQASRIKDRIEIQIGPGRYPILTEDLLAKLMQERAPWFNGSIEDIRWRIVVRFEKRLAKQFGNQRIWLAGDAAHMTGPAGIQSMNIGFREAQDLVQRLSGVLKRGDKLEGLDAYSKNWHEQWRFLLGVDGDLAASDKTDAWIREHRAQLLPSLPASGADLKRIAAQLNLTL